MHEVFEALVRLLAPILAFTADEAWEHAGREGSIHEEEFPVADGRYADGGAGEKVEQLLELRGVIQNAIEEQVQAKAFNKNNEAAVELALPAAHPCRDLLADRDFATEFFIISELTVVDGPEVSARAAKSGHGMCPRCRRYEPSDQADGLCARCAEVVQ
jgi:isoleucyl-tRNA synthetase